MIGIEDADVDRLANLMGHYKEIHKNVYRVDVSIAEMTLVAKLIESVMNDEKGRRDSVEEAHGESENSSSSDDSEEENIDNVDLGKRNNITKSAEQTNVAQLKMQNILKYLKVIKKT